MQEEWDELHHGVHPKSLHPEVEVGKYPGTNDGGGAHLRPLDEIPRPLLDQGRD